MLMQELRLGAADTACARAQVPWLRDRLLKLGVQLIRSVRRLVLHLPRRCTGWWPGSYAVWSTGANPATAR